jgi:outer membrane lipoprotein-sorting protein
MFPADGFFAFPRFLMKKFVPAFFIMLCAAAGLFAENSILTASAFFQSVSAEYGSIKDYEASVSIKAGRTAMNGKVSFKRPDLLRIDFSSPQDQVIVFNGDMLTIYLPESQAVLNQSVQSGNGGSQAGGANLATPQGLSLMSRYYTVAYETGSDPVALEDGSDEMVVRLVLSRRNTSEAFRFIKLSIIPDSKLIRRVEAVTPQGEVFLFDFTNYALNQGISDQRFIYDAPSSANNYNNFLFSEQ